MRNLLLVLALTVILSACAQEEGANIVTSNNPVTVSSNSQSRSEGTVNGGGGVGVRCGDKLEVLDLYEARSAGLQMPKTPSTKGEAVAFVSSRMARHFWNLDTVQASEYESIMAKDIVLPLFEGRAFINYATDKSEEVHFVEQLPLSNDFGKYTLPSGCFLEQIAFFSDAKTQLSIVKSAWDKLDWMSKSVLIAHELLYLLDRREGLKRLIPKAGAHTSEVTRKFVGQLFSEASLVPHSDRMPNKEDLFVCRDADSAEETSTYFYAFDDKDSGRLSLVFNVVLGSSGLYQLRSDFRDLTVTQLLNQSGGNISAKAKLNSVGSGASTHLKVNLSRQENSALVLSLSYIVDGKTQIIGSPQTLSCAKF